MKNKIMTAQEAVNLIKDEDTVVCDGFLMTNTPEEILEALGKRFAKEHHPQKLDVWFPCGVGNYQGKGLDHLAQKGMLSRVVGSHWGSMPKLQKMVNNNDIEAYCLPQGVIIQMMRDSATQKPITISKTGLDTFVDYTQTGGALNTMSLLVKSAKKASKQLVHRVEINGQTYLAYQTPKPDVALITGGTADENGNISFENKDIFLTSVILAFAAHGNGGKVIVQVKKTVKNGALDPKQVKLPSAIVDYVVVESSNEAVQTPQKQKGSTPLPEIVLVAAKQAVKFLDQDDKMLNLGIGKYPEAVGQVLKDSGQDFMTTLESGVFGGDVQTGGAFGTAIGAQAIVDNGYMFDFYDGKGLDATLLGLAEVDQNGNVNVSKFGKSIAGCGGFIDITQNTPKVIFIGSFTAGGLKEEIQNGKLKILHEGAIHKFVQNVQQITFSGNYANETDQEVYFVTERATFKLTPNGLKLLSYASGVDLKRDVLNQMDFMPIIAKDVKRYKLKAEGE